MNWIRQQRVELYLAFLTWLGVILLLGRTWIAGDIQSSMGNIDMPTMNMPNLILCALLLVAFMVGYVLSYGEFNTRLPQKFRLTGLAISCLSVFALSLQFYFSYVAILAIIVVSQTPEFFRPRYACAIAIIIPIIGGIIDSQIHHFPHVFENVLLYSLFNLFALLICTRFLAERQAKEESRQLVRELKATQMLLSSASKRDERLRIARDLHDAIGHHLTALSLQLEVANHVEGDTAKTHIQQARAISHLLLSDVREAVSEIRQQKDWQLSEALHTLTQDIPNLDVNLVIDHHPTDSRQTEVLFRCVQEALTNVIKHAQASQCSISLTNKQGPLLNIYDNGKSNTDIIPGNGLKGMAERVKNLGGQLRFHNHEQGFELIVQLPEDETRS
ncbi:sensor histidine kinase [Teredinibacter sp. KSP-S5-2]|uniref:sensor histidine kinase n=1 Tax=Teredinibacter sp. KSP-S5-2 TaxID=3034506 RepID=UPI002934BCAE|nr:histidine kinase [Teredinibacter sp. KSP-S5-2]WNO10714.1 histidine kinase [Teredinibacter sp. KSP-S5-2]